jgi:hypothetical protein
MMFDFVVSESSNSGSVAFAGLYTLLSTYLAFWQQTARLTPPPVVVAEGDVGGEREQKSSSSLLGSKTTPRLGDIISDGRKFALSMTVLFGGDQDKVSKLLQQMDNIRIDNAEVLISELIGIPIPSHCVDLPLVTVQANIAPHINHLQGYFKQQPSRAKVNLDSNRSLKMNHLFMDDGLQHTLPSSPISNSPVQLTRWDTKSAHRLAKSSQRSVPIISEQEDEEEGEEGGERQAGGFRSIHDGIHPSGRWATAPPSSSLPPTHLRVAGDDLQSQQRVEKVTSYVTELQHKLDGRTNILKGLLHLLRSCQKTSPNRKHRPDVTYGGDDGVSEISTKLHNLQKRLLIEMQKKRSTRIELVSKCANYTHIYILL